VRAGLPAAPGAYALWITLRAPLALPIPRLGRPVLPPGRYVYCGSAGGPGGIRARVGRHLRPGKRARWHVDHLTGAGVVTAIVAVPEGDECRLAVALLDAPGTAVPVPGLGSSDCRVCAAHLLGVAPATDPAFLATAATRAGLAPVVLATGRA